MDTPRDSQEPNRKKTRRALMNDAVAPSAKTQGMLPMSVSYGNHQPMYQAQHAVFNEDPPQKSEPCSLGPRPAWSIPVWVWQSNPVDHKHGMEHTRVWLWQQRFHAKTKLRLTHHPAWNMNMRVWVWQHCLGDHHTIRWTPNLTYMEHAHVGLAAVSSIMNHKPGGRSARSCHRLINLACCKCRMAWYTYHRCQDCLAVRP